MRKLLVITLLLFSAVTFAQDKFIEVEVGDTITIRPERFDVEIFILTDAQNEDISQDIKKVKQALAKYKYRTSGTGTLYPPLSAPSTEVISVSLTDEKQWVELYKLLSSFHFVRVEIGEFTIKDHLMMEDILYKKLLEKARAKAAVIAAVSDMTVGNVITVKEAEGMDGFELNIHDTYFVAEDSKKLQMHDGRLIGSLYKKLVVRFGVK